MGAASPVYITVSDHCSSLGKKCSGTARESSWRRDVSIGDTLAEARRQAGLTLTQVSQQTRIRESIIRSIEQDDFSPCGGDFYARGHIRSIAEVVGVDPVPLIREYDDRARHAGQHARGADLRAGHADQDPRAAAACTSGGCSRWRCSRSSASAPTTWSRRRNTHSSATPTRDPAAGRDGLAEGRQAEGARPRVAGRTRRATRSVIKLTAISDCWVGLTSQRHGQSTRASSRPGQTMTWTEKKPVTMVIGNPPGSS